MDGDNIDWIFGTSREGTFSKGKWLVVAVIVREKRKGCAFD